MCACGVSNCEKMLANIKSLEQSGRILDWNTTNYHFGLILCRSISWPWSMLFFIGDGAKDREFVHRMLHYPVPFWLAVHSCGSKGRALQHSKFSMRKYAEHVAAAKSKLLFDEAKKAIPRAPRQDRNKLIGLIRVVGCEAHEHTSSSWKMDTKTRAKWSHALILDKACVASAHSRPFFDDGGFDAFLLDDAVVEELLCADLQELSL